MILDTRFCPRRRTSGTMRDHGLVVPEVAPAARYREEGLIQGRAAGEHPLPAWVVYGFSPGS